jgi:hypothetical protein
VLLSDSRGSGKRSIGKAWRSWLRQAATMLEHDRACGGATMELNMIPDFFLESSDHPPSTHQHAQHSHQPGPTKGQVPSRAAQSE